MFRPRVLPSAPPPAGLPPAGHAGTASPRAQRGARSVTAQGRGPRRRRPGSRADAEENSPLPVYDRLAPDTLPGRPDAAPRRPEPAPRAPATH